MFKGTKEAAVAAVAAGAACLTRAITLVRQHTSDGSILRTCRAVHNSVSDAYYSCTTQTLSLVHHLCKTCSVYNYNLLSQRLSEVLLLDKLTWCIMIRHPLCRIQR